MLTPKQKRHLGFGAIILVVFVLVVFGCLASSANYNYCVGHKGEHETGQYDKKGAPIIAGPIDRPSAVNLFVYCGGNYANENGSGITALATILLTAVTGLLAWLAFIQTVNGHRQLRAYVFVESGSLYEGSMMNPQIQAYFGVPGIALTIKNTGQTPAKDVFSWAGIDIIEPRHEKTLVVPAFDKMFALSLGAGGTFPKMFWHTRALTAQDIADVLNRNKGIYLYGKIIYKDVFGLEHFTNFRIVYFGPFPSPAGSMSFTTCIEGNDFD